MQATSKFFPNASATVEDELFRCAADYFGLLSDPSRLRVLAVLCTASSELSVNEIVRRCSMPQPNVSRHLSRLYRAGVADRRRKQTEVFYMLKDSSIRELCLMVAEKFVTTEKCS